MSAFHPNLPLRCELQLRPKADTLRQMPNAFVGYEEQRPSEGVRKIYPQ